MTGVNDQTDKVSPPSQTRQGRIHFALAAGMLLVAAVVWNIVLVGKYFAKKPVPPPANAQFDNHRLVNFPDKIGPYVLLGDGELSKERDGEPDGLFIMRDDDLETLGTMRHDMNWYYMALYRDTRAGPGGAGRFIRLDITYYTGLLEAVPHVGERCIVAGGGTIDYSQCKPVPVNLLPLSSKWDQWQNIKMYRTTYEIRQKDGVVTRASQYHIFSMNGEPIYDWMKVRWKMGALSLKYCYFAKIQIATQAPEPDVKKSDDICGEFIRHILPEVLQFLASPDDVKKLEDRD
ncbi:MAG: hypothetical protein KAV00_07265 [Phycisphaerae bacterium]|nr:hypothetical protein [Phycisphaerae bacterium]